MILSVSGGWHENKMVLVSKKFWQSQPARGRVAQGRGPWKIFIFIANMAKLSFNGGSEVFPEYSSLFDVTRYCQLQGFNGLAAFYHYCERFFHCSIVERQTILCHVESQMTMGQTSAVLDE